MRSHRQKPQAPRALSCVESEEEVKRLPWGGVCIMVFVLGWLLGFGSGVVAERAKYREPLASCPYCDGRGVVTTRELPRKQTLRLEKHGHGNMRRWAVVDGQEVLAEIYDQGRKESREAVLHALESVDVPRHGEAVEK